MVKNILLVAVSFYFGKEYAKKTGSGMTSNEAVSAVGHDLVQDVKSLFGYGSEETTTEDAEDTEIETWQ